MAEDDARKAGNSNTIRKGFAGLLVLLGLALVIRAIYFALTPNAETQSGSLPKTVGEIFAFLLGAGANIKGWMDLFKSDDVKGKKQVNIGDGTNIQADTVNVFSSAPKEAESHDTIGFIPPANVVTYIPRGRIEEDVRTFLKNGGSGAIIGLHAPGGLGKTELAKHAAEELKDQFEGILWVDVGEKKPHQVVADMLLKCGVQMPPASTYEQQKNELHHALHDRQLLVVLDDVRKDALEGLNDFLPSKPCSTLITSRIEQIGGVNKTFPLDHMTQDQARELMTAVLGEDIIAAEKEAADKLAERCAFNPLAVEIAARRIRQMQGTKKPISHYFEKAQAHFSELAMSGDKRWDMRYIFDLSYDDLSSADQKRFRTLAAFHPTGFAPQAVSFLWENEEDETSKALMRFINLSLVKSVPMEIEDMERFRLHDLLDEYTQSKIAKEEETEARNKLAQWIIALFTEYYTDDKTTAPLAFLERANLLRSCEWARGQKNGELLAMLITQSRNWFYIGFTEDWHFWIAWLEASLQLGFNDSTNKGKQLKANVLQAIGDVQQFRKQMDAALTSYQEALKLFKAVGSNLGEANVLQSLGTERLSQQDFTKALEYYQLAQANYEKIGDRYSQSRNNIFVAYARVGSEEYDRAMEALTNSVILAEEIEVESLRRSALEYMAAISKERKSWASLNDILPKLIASHPGDFDLTHIWASALYEQKEYEQALSAFQHIMEVAPSDSSLWNEMANVLESLERFEETITAYTRAIEISPDSAYLYRNRANALLMLDRLNEAEKDITKAVELEPDHPYTRARQGYLVLAQGKFAEAIPYFEFASQNDESKSWKIGLALSKFAIGNFEEAQKELSTLLSDSDGEERKDTSNWLEKIIKLRPELEKNAQPLRDLLS